MMKRNLAAGLAVAVAASNAASAETLTVSTNNPPSHFAVVHGLQPLMDCVVAKNVGIDFSFFPSSQIATDKVSLDSMNSDLVQISYIVTTVLSDKLPLANISLLPNMGTTVTQMVAAWNTVLTDGGPMADELKANNILPLYVNMFPAYQIALSEGKIETLADFAGKKIRVAGGAPVFAVNSLNAVPVQMAAGDTYVGMQQGTIDGYMLALTSVDSYKLQEVSASITTNANFAGAQAFVAMDDRYFAKLSEDKQSALLECGKQVENSLATYTDQMISELAKKFADEGVDMYELSDATLVELDKVLQLAVDDYIKRLTDLGLPAQAALDQYNAALGK